MKCSVCEGNLLRKRKLYCSDKCRNRAKYVRSLEESIAHDCATAVTRWRLCLDWKKSLEGTRGLRRMLIERSVRDAAMGLDGTQMEDRRKLDKRLLSQPKKCACPGCPKTFLRNKGEDPASYIRRLFCSQVCAFESVKSKQNVSAVAEERAS